MSTDSNRRHVMSWNNK